MSLYLVTLMLVTGPEDFSGKQHSRQKAPCFSSGKTGVRGRSRKLVLEAKQLPGVRVHGLHWGWPSPRDAVCVSGGPAQGGGRINSMCSELHGLGKYLRAPRAPTSTPTASLCPGRTWPKRRGPPRAGQADRRSRGHPAHVSARACDKAWCLILVTFVGGSGLGCSPAQRAESEDEGTDVRPGGPAGSREATARLAAL